MSVTLFDGTYSFRQNELATKGIQHGGHKMSSEQAKAFEASPFMIKARQQEEYTSQLSSERDKMRKQTDKEFQPCDDDFTAAKAFDYDKGINYYTVLGVDEYAPLEEIKKAYKKLSLLYHPDKTAGLTKEEQEERASIFIEIKNAYLVLGDQARLRTGFTLLQDSPAVVLGFACKLLPRLQALVVLAYASWPPWLNLCPHAAFSPPRTCWEAYSLLEMKIVATLLLLQHAQFFLASGKKHRIANLALDNAFPRPHPVLPNWRARIAQLRGHVLPAESSENVRLQEQRTQEHSIVPAPQSVVFMTGALSLPRGSAVLIKGGTEEDQAALKQNVLNLADLSATSSASLVIELLTEPVKADGIQNEAYSLDVSDGKISLKSATSHGLFNAMMTLRQVINWNENTVSIPELHVVDAPAHEWRGLMLDVSRHFFSADEVKHLLRTMAIFKLNRFHWHLSDDQGFRLPIDKYPKLTSVSSWRDSTQVGHNAWRQDHQRYGGSYTKEEVREIMRLAGSLHITVVPETDLPGHAEAILAAYPEFSNQDAVFEKAEVMKTWGVSNFVMAPNEKTFSFVSDLVREVSDLVDSKYYHVGGDEVPSTQWDRSASARSYEHRNHLHSTREIAGMFTKKAIDTANELGRAGVVWDEALSTGVPLPRDSVVMIWRDWDNVPSKLRLAEALGLPVVMCPHSATYLDFAQGPADPYDSQQDIVDLHKVYNLQLDGHGAHVLGGQGQLWSEFISRGLGDLDFKAWPRGAAIAEATWSGSRRPGYEDFKRRVRARAPDFERLGIHLQGATRRQYDRDRDFATAGSQVNGYQKRKDRAPFDATEMMKKIQEHYKPPGQEIDVEVFCKLEKFFYGGAKRVVRNRRVIRDFQEFYEDKQFRIDVPKGAEECWEIKMKGGDMHLQTQTDMLRFVLKSKPHKALERRGSDLYVTKELRLRPDAHLQPVLSAAVNTVDGRSVFLWGQNPLYSQAASSTSLLKVSIEGEGIGEKGQLHFAARVSRPGSHETLVVKVHTTHTKISFFVGVRTPATVEDLQESIRDILQWPEDQPVLLRRRSEEKQELSSLEEEVLLDCTALRVAEVPMAPRRSRDLLAAVTAFAGTESFSEGLSSCLQAAGTARHEGLLRKLWEPASHSALLCGYAPTLEGLWAATERALWVLREEVDAEVLQGRLAQLGFRARRPLSPWIPRRRKLPREEMEDFLIRNALGPPSWAQALPDPGSETEPEEEAVDFQETRARRQREQEEERSCLRKFLLHGASQASTSRKRAGPFGAAAHPLMLRRAEHRARLSAECLLKLRPLFAEPMQLVTKPTCFLHFYSNLGQEHCQHPDHLQPTPVFAVAVCCPTGAKRAGREEWMRLRHSLMPLLKQGPIVFLAQARQLLPRQLLAQPAVAEYQSTTGVSVTSGQGPEAEADGESSDEENGAEAAEVIQLARQRLVERAGGDVDFDDLDILDELEEAAAAIRRELREQRRCQKAAREASRRQLELEAKAKAKAQDMPESDSSDAQPPWLWKRLATGAFKRGDYYQAQHYYTKEASCYGLPPFTASSLFPDEGDRHAVNGDLPECHKDLATALSNRALCFLRLRHFEAALQDGRRAAELCPTWARAWSRVGAAASASSVSEACEAWRRAVQLEPCASHLEGLEAMCRLGGQGANKENGNEAMRARDWHGAIACFTEALAAIPPQSDAKDGYSLLRCILLSNRSAALARAGRWTQATLDAERAIAEEQTYPKAHTRLGVALLGCRENEKAYVAFAAALKVEERNQAASKGRQACLQLIPRWQSSAANSRSRRFWRDTCRPKGSSRVYLLSELRFGHASNESWVHGIHATKFLDDVLILTGNVADSLRALERALTALRPKFRRIFYTPGNNEMWITPLESQMFPDSLCKLWAILELCDRLGVDVMPAAVSEGVYVVPMFSWYNPEFDVADPYPDPQFQHDKHAKWPMDPMHQVWRYMLALNRTALQKPYHGTVITFSHFVPRSSLPVAREYGGAKVSGCAELDDQLREARSSCHLYGHVFKNYCKEIEDVVYVNYAHQGGGQDEPLPCIFNGERLCCDMVAVH
ncbi:unnamed protein product [Effrenium voratum]|uniref:beta-N-acetylhexosaminidase n=1 Tax=Effrenium voratum TaxID=2562239 RepID=A0AA36J8G6_9DINO|nr:unnamed protein product [Effrenium voratum]CAJ1454354.1 unnamed protein product [Effrenium voratum]